MKYSKNAILFLLVFHSFVSMAIAEMWQLDTNSCARAAANVLLYLEKGVDLDAYDTLSWATHDYYVKSGPGTLLGKAVRQNCVEAVQLLLEHGADPNLHSGDLTPLLSNLLNLSKTAAIEDEALREQARAPMREIRDLLISHGAYCDGSPLRRRWFINDFRRYLSSTNENSIYVFCMTNQIIIDDHNSVQQFDVPIVSEGSLSGHHLRPILASVLEAQKTITNANALLIGEKDVAFSVNTLYHDQGVATKVFAIPSFIACDAKTLTDLFLNHPDAFTEDMMKLLDEVSPQSGRFNPIAHIEAELMAL